MTPRRIYVASSWRNEGYPAVVDQLRAAGHEVYDFRHPNGQPDGFHWSTVASDMPPRQYATGQWQDWSFEEFAEALEHPAAVHGFTLDFDAMRWADTCVCVLPCGRSAHLELGWFVGAGRTSIILRDPLEGEPAHHFAQTSGPELMYRMVDMLASSIFDVLTYLDSTPLSPTADELVTTERHQ